MALLSSTKLYAQSDNTWQLTAKYFGTTSQQVGACQDAQGQWIVSPFCPTGGSMTELCSQIGRALGLPSYTDYGGGAGIRKTVRVKGNPTVPDVGVCIIEIYDTISSPPRLTEQIAGSTYYQCQPYARPPLGKDEVDAVMPNQCQLSCPQGTQKSGPYSCKAQTCPVEPISKITDPVALQFEAKNGDAVVTDQQSAAAKEGWRIVQATLGVAPKMTSAYRPTAYQAHLVEVTNKYKDVSRREFLTENPTCASIKAGIEAEFVTKHRLNGTIAAPGKSAHETGNAFDFVPTGGMSLVDAFALVSKSLSAKDYLVLLERDPKTKEPKAIHVEVRKK